MKKAKDGPLLPYEFKLKKRARPPVFGKQMYETINQAKVVLNIHADSSNRFASNKRLFETTGVGTCLLTDWRSNLNQLFEDGKEVISYRSTEECIDKVNWLLNHPEECLEIGRQAQKKTLSTHTYAHRAEELISIIRKHI